MGETITGNTMFMLTPEADMGDIVDQRVIPIGDEDTCADIYARVGCAGAEMLRTHLPALLAGTAPRRPQELGDAEPLPKRTPAMGITTLGSPIARRARLDPRADAAVPRSIQPASRPEGHALALGAPRPE